MNTLNDKPITYWDLQKDIKDAVIEHLNYNKDELKDLEVDNINNSIQDDLHEMIDSCIPIYNSDRLNVVNSHLNIGFLNDTSLVESCDNIFDFAAICIYEYISEYAYENLNTWIESWLESEAVNQ